MTKLLFIAALVACGSKSPEPAKPEAKPESKLAPDSIPKAPPEPDTAKPPEPPKPDPEKVKADAVAAETAAYDKAKPVFTKYCANCHTKTGKKATAKKLGHLDMTTYPFGGEHAKSIGNEIRVVLAIDGHKKASMPDDKPGSVKGDDLDAIKAWTEAWQAAGAAGAHPAEPADKDDD
jgi:mono/diheme cytochrome c family protein